jgi:hypothetical protein
MTFIDTSAISDAVQTVLFKPERSISVQGTTPEGVSRTIIADVTVEEDMRDELDITDHPVEGTGRGTTYISDHALQASRRAGHPHGVHEQPDQQPVFEWRNQRHQQHRGERDFREQQRGAIQPTARASGQPLLCKIVTGKRTYVNMLLAALSVITDVRTENALIATARFREIILVLTRIVQVQTPDQYTKPITNRGQISLIPASQLGNTAFIESVQNELAADQNGQ